MKTHLCIPTNLRTVFIVLACLALLPATGEIAKAETIGAKVSIRGAIFNKPTRQHIQANFQGRGTLRPSGDRGRANGGISSLRNDRIPRPSIFGVYRVLVRAQVRYGGGGSSVSKKLPITVRRKSIVVGRYGRIRLKQALRPTKTGRQRIRGTGHITVRGV